MRCGGGFTEVVGMSIRSRLAKNGETRKAKKKRKKVNKREREKNKKGVAPLIGAASRIRIPHDLPVSSLLLYAQRETR